MRPLDETERQLLVVNLKLIANNAGMAASAAASNSDQLEKYLFEIEKNLEVVRRMVPRPPQLGSGT